MRGAGRAVSGRVSNTRTPKVNTQPEKYDKVSVSFLIVLNPWPNRYSVWRTA